MNAANLINQNSGNAEIYTPPAIIEAARACMGGIDLDPASCAKANLSMDFPKCQCGGLLNVVNPRDNPLLDDAKAAAGDCSAADSPALFNRLRLGARIETIAELPGVAVRCDGCQREVRAGDIATALRIFSPAWGDELDRLRHAAKLPSAPRP